MYCRVDRRGRFERGSRLDRVKAVEGIDIHPGI
jgi:hypothetical protein